MDMPTIAVMGAAGNVGGKVADRLLRDGHGVRVLEHRRPLEEFARRGAEVVPGDAADVAALRALFAGAAAAFVLLPDIVTEAEFVATRSRMSRAIVDALRATRVEHVVALSVVGADRADAVGPPAGLHELERRVAELGDANVLVLRPASYMDNLLAALPLVQARKVNASALAGDLKIPMVATRDVAVQAAERLVRRDFTGHTARLLLGPEDVSMRAATRALGERLGLPELPYVQLPPADAKGGLMAAGMLGEAAELLVEMQLAINDGRLFGGVRRTAQTTTSTRLEVFLDAELNEGARR